MAAGSSSVISANSGLVDIDERDSWVDEELKRATGVELVSVMVMVVVAVVVVVVVSI